MRGQGGLSVDISTTRVIGLAEGLRIIKQRSGGVWRLAFPFFFWLPMVSSSVPCSPTVYGRSSLDTYRP